MIMCAKHGDLKPCKEHAIGSGRKDPTKCPVPSFVRIAISNIPDAGHGVFAIQFVKPGQIIGQFLLRSVLDVSMLLWSA